MSAEGHSAVRRLLARASAPGRAMAALRDVRLPLDFRAEDLDLCREDWFAALLQQPLLNVIRGADPLARGRPPGRPARPKREPRDTAVEVRSRAGGAGAGQGTRHTAPGIAGRAAVRAAAPEETGGALRLDRAQNAALAAGRRNRLPHEGTHAPQVNEPAVPVEQAVLPARRSFDTPRQDKRKHVLVSREAARERLRGIASRAGALAAWEWAAPANSSPDTAAPAGVTAVSPAAERLVLALERVERARRQLRADEAPSAAAWEPPAPEEEGRRRESLSSGAAWGPPAPHDEVRRRELPSAVARRTSGLRRLAALAGNAPPAARSVEPAPAEPAAPSPSPAPRERAPGPQLDEVEFTRLLTEVLRREARRFGADPQEVG